MATRGYTDYDSANQNSGGVAGEFIERQKDRLTRGVQNVEATVGDRPRRAVERTIAYTGRTTARVGKNMKEQALRMEASGQAGMTTAALKRSGDAVEQTGRVLRAASRGFSFGRVNPLSARFQIGMAMGLTGLLNTFSFVMGVLTLAALGMVGAVAAIPLGETAVNVVAYFFGINNFDIWILVVATLVLHLLFVLTMFVTAYLQLKLGGIQPIHGKASSVKTLALVGAFVVSIIPGANFVPWIWVWLFVVGLFPN
jgi:hypothetical protein